MFVFAVHNDFNIVARQYRLWRPNTRPGGPGVSLLGAANNG